MEYIIFKPCGYFVNFIKTFKLMLCCDLKIMRIKKEITKQTPSGEVEELQKERQKRNGMQYELTDSALDHWSK